MKIKTTYIYLTIIAAVVIWGVFILIKEPATRTKTKQIPVMPKAAHNQFNSSLPKPTKSNVNKSFLNKLSSLKKEIEKNPSDTLSMREYADLISLSHNPEEGNKYYLKILKINPKRIDILFALVSNYYNLRKIKKAEKFNNKILKISPNNAGAMYNRGIFLALKGKTKEAHKIWETILRKFPNSPIAKSALKNINGTER